MKFITPVLNVVTLLCLLSSSHAVAAIALDRTRVIFNATDKSVTLNITNQNEKSPYLAQGWLENAEGLKITTPLVVLPPIQRLEPGAKSQVKVQALPEAAALPKDRESVFYFNLREVPPKSEKANTLQFALQTRIKLFYRPTPIIPTRIDLDNPWQEKLTMKQQGDDYQINNPTPYYITLVYASSKAEGQAAKNFIPLMLEPYSQASLGASAAELGMQPIVTYVNDYGGNPQLQFTCRDGSCTAAPLVLEK